MSHNTDPERQPLVSSNAQSPRSLTYKVSNLLVILIIFFVIALGVLITSTTHYVQKRNVILLISDGFGPASEAYGREFARYIGALDAGGVSPLDSILVGQSRTKSSSSLVTDSAAGATAFSCAMKTYNNAVGVDPEGNPCGTVLEAAKAEGMLTGLVVTSRVTHAIPAAFSAHVLHRDMENDIAEQQLGFYPLGRQVDLMFGGGECEFLPNSTQGSCRSDDRDLKKEGKEKFNWDFLTKEDFDELPSDRYQLPIAALFAKSHIPYDIDRNVNEQPSLKEMTQKALKILSRASATSSQGFFLMIEGSRIDMAAHDNDPAAHAREILAYYEAISAVKAFINTHPDTVMISVSDHETGGFTLGRQIGPEYPEYIWYPEVIKNVKNSAFTLAQKYLNYQGDRKKSYLRQEILSKGLGIDHVSDDEWKKLQNCTTIQDFNYAFGDMVSRRAMLGWTTHGHTSVDVNLYAYGHQSERLAGNRENIEIGQFIAQFLDLNLNKITDRLRSNFMKPINSLMSTFSNYEYQQHN